MLDLQPIKDRLEMASPDKGRRVGYPPDADLKNHAYEDLAALVAEVERLRDSIARHKRRCVIDPQPWDRDLWEVLE